MKFKDMKKLKNSGQVPDFGAIFMSDRSTKEECFQRKLFGLPYVDADFVMKVKAGMILFLFEYTKRELYGVFQATSDGQMNIVPSAYSSYGKRFPAQVRFSTIWKCHQPLSEGEFGEAIRENYFSHYKFNFGLSKDQVYRLLWLFDSRRVGAPKHGHLSLVGDPNMSCKTPKSTYCNLSNDSNVIGLQCSSTSAYQEEPKNLNTELGDFIPLSSSESASTTDRDAQSPEISDVSLGVKGLYSDIPTEGCSVFSRVNMSRKESPQVEVKRREESKTMLKFIEDMKQKRKPSTERAQVYENKARVDKSVLEFIEDMKQKRKPSTERAHVRENKARVDKSVLKITEDMQQKRQPSIQKAQVGKNRAKVDKSVLEIMVELQQKHEEWRVRRQSISVTKQNRDLTARKRSVFSRLEVASKHDFKGDRSSHGVREELHQHGFKAERPIHGLRQELHGRHRKRKASPDKKENEVSKTERRRKTVFSRLNWVSETKQPTSDHQEAKLSENKVLIRNRDDEENFNNTSHMKIRKFPHTSKETNSGLSPKRKSELLKAESDLEKSGNQHKKRRVNPLLSKKSSDAVSESCPGMLVLSQESKNEKNGDTDQGKIDLSQEGQVSSGVFALDCKGNNGEFSKSTDDCESKLVELVAKTCYGDVTRKILKTYKRRSSIASPTVQDCNQKVAEKEGNVMFPEIVVPTENPNENCSQKKSLEKGNAECFNPSAKTDRSAAHSDELSSAKAGAQAENH